MLCPREGSLSFSYSDMFMTTVVLPLSAGSTIMSVSLFRSWRVNRSCSNVWWGDKGGLVLEKILIICGYYLWILSACSDNR